MSRFTEEQLNKISHLVREVEKLTNIEKLLLYLQLPCGRPELLEGGKSRFSGKQVSTEHLIPKKPDQETTQTYTWILSHLEEDPNVSLPKQEVYDEYKAFCQANRLEALCVADFGKAMKHAFPCIKPRRLGQRGNSRYCYSGLRKKYKIQAPTLPDMIEPTFCIENDCSQSYKQIIRDCRDNPSECPLNNQPPDFSGFEAMNLKVEPNNQHNHHPHDNGSNIATNIYNGPDLADKHRTHDLSNKTRPGLSGISHVLNSGSSSNMSMPMIHEAMNHHPISLNNCSTTANYLSTHTQSKCSYQGLMQRSGTPDDDDYRHNYQDLNRPIVGTSIPFSQNLSLHSMGSQHPTTSNFLYNSPQHQPPPSTTTVSTTTATNTNQSSTKPLAHHHSRIQLAPRHETGQIATSLATNQAITSTTTTTVANSHQSASNSVNTNVNNHLEQNHQNHFSGSGLTNNNTVGQHQQQVQQQHPLLFCNTVNHPDMDYCTSPFQSPASTPYPIMGNYLSQEVQDYYSADCIRYSEH